MWENHNNKSRRPSSSIPRHLFLQCCALSSTPLDFQGLVLMCVALLVCRVETIINLRLLLRSCVSVSGQRPSSISASAMWRSSSSNERWRRPHSVYHFRYLSRPASNTRLSIQFYLFFFFDLFFLWMRPVPLQQVVKFDRSRHIT
jgi:hypothetical protein